MHVLSAGYYANDSIIQSACMMKQPYIGLRPCKLKYHFKDYEGNRW